MNANGIAMTGIKPTGDPHLGNYLGMIEPALRLAREHPSYLFVADYHALTTMRDPADLARRTTDVAAALLALGAAEPERRSSGSPTCRRSSSSRSCSRA